MREHTVDELYSHFWLYCLDCQKPVEIANGQLPLMIMKKHVLEDCRAQSLRQGTKETRVNPDGQPIGFSPCPQGGPQ